MLGGLGGDDLGSDLLPYASTPLEEADSARRLLDPIYLTQVSVALVQRAAG